MQGVKDWTVDCLKDPGTGYREWIKRVKDWAAACSKLKRRGKKTTLRVIELNSTLILPRPSHGGPTRFQLDSVKFEEYKV